MPLPTTADDVWPHIEKWPFGVLSFVTPKGESRGAGVMYQVKDRVLYVLPGGHLEGPPHPLQPERVDDGADTASADPDPAGAPCGDQLLGKGHDPAGSTRSGPSCEPG